MDDTTAASAGFALAGVAFAASLFGWQRGALVVTLVGAALAGVALVAFGLRRYGRLDRRMAAIVAGVASIGVVAAALYATFQGGVEPWGFVVVSGGVGSAVAAYADWLALDRASLSIKTSATLVGAFFGALGLLAIVVWVYVFGFLVAIVAPSALDDPTVQSVLSTFATGAGTVSIVAIYLRYSDRGLPYLDVAWPGLRGLAYAFGGAFVILGGNVVIGLAFQRFGLETAQHAIVQTAEADPTVLLALIPLSFLVIGPGEELLYRNVVQKSLREVFSPVAGVVLASAIFAAVHFTAYLNAELGLLGTLNTLVIVFGLALILGAVYELTGNVVVSALAHGTFNAVAFAATYAQLTGLLG